ncbi:MAG: DUF4394 domain-containing protein [Gemmatimonadales bacterium]
MNPKHSKTLGPTALLLAALALAACGEGGGLTDQTPPPPDDPPDDGGEPPAPNVEGYTIYAVTLDNRLLLFGSENPGTIARTVNISGLPFLNRIVGLDFRPSNGKLYGVGNDSRVYTLDPATGVATPVSPTRFEPHIFGFFDVHFGMGFDPVTERIRLIAAESGMNWSIGPDDGVAVRGKDVSYAAGDPNEGHKPAILGLAYTPPGAATARAGSLRGLSARLGPQDLCEDLMWAIDAELAEIIGSCDPDEGDFTSLGPLQGIAGVGLVFNCGEVKFDPEGNLYAAVLWRDHTLKLRVSLFRIDPETGELTKLRDLPDVSPIQALAFDFTVPFQPALRPKPAAASLSLAPAAAGGVPAPPGSGELASCAGESR